MPTDMPPSQMKTASPSAQRKDVTPWESAGRRIAAVIVPEKKFTEPVALSSPEPAGFPLPRTALGLGFDLLALRARCKRHTTTRRGGAQGEGRRESALFAQFPFRADGAGRSCSML